MSGFMRQFAEARREIRNLATTTPHIFPEWQELEAAKRSLADAQERFARARKAWNEVLGTAPTTGGEKP